MTAPSEVLHVMRNRRIPLMSLPNAANSPLQSNPAAGTKRTRSHAGEQRDLPNESMPPAKKQVVEFSNSNHRRQNPSQKNVSERSTTFQRKLEALRVSKPIQRAPEGAQKSHNESVETVRQWQKHYRKAFPEYVFYFESIPDDLRARAVRQVNALGAREEKFFSKSVTHVVTSRPIPPESSVTASSEAQTGLTKRGVSHDDGMDPKTINPALLQQLGDLQSHPQQHKNRLAFDTSIPKRSQSGSQAQNADILHKAREMGMKIWALEKLQRMMTTMFSADIRQESGRTHSRPVNRGLPIISIPGRGADLSLLLQNEKLAWQADRDWGAVTHEVVLFRGYYMYIHDVDEKTRPVMVRDYPKPPTKEQGQWPQFRLTAPGKCPFVEEPARAKRAEHPQQRELATHAGRLVQPAHLTRTEAVPVVSKQRAPNMEHGAQVLVEIDHNIHRKTGGVQTPTQPVMSKPLGLPYVRQPKTENDEDIPPLFGSAQANIRALPRCVRGEPVASGVQRSQVTSAIRSQMVSSTSALSGVRTGASKEIHHLKRKVLERYSAPSADGVPSSHINDVRAAINHDNASASRAAKRQATGRLKNIDEETSHLDGNAASCRNIAMPREKVEKDLKPGYCENCREKFEDFEEHVLSRKHRKFAMTADNWKELDALLSQLLRTPR